MGFLGSSHRSLKTDFIVINKESSKHRHYCYICVKCWTPPPLYTHTHKENIEKCLDLTRELKKLWNMIEVIPVVMGALGTASRNLEVLSGNWNWDRRLQIFKKNGLIYARILWKSSWNVMYCFYIHFSLFSCLIKPYFI